MVRSRNRTPPRPLLLVTMTMMLFASHHNFVDAFGLESLDAVHHGVHALSQGWMDAVPTLIATGAGAPATIEGLGSPLLPSWSGEISSSTLAAASSVDDPFAFAEPTGALLSPADIWALRIGSALATYFGFVTVTDRPRGSLALPLASDSERGCLRVGPSTVPGAGLGLFVTVDLPGGTVLGTYPGVVLPLQQHSAASKIRDHPGCLTYIWRFTDNQFVIDPTTSADGTLGDICDGGNPSQFGSVAFFGLLRALGIAPRPSTALCRINEPPIGKDVNVATEEDLEGRIVTFKLERDVYAGEELHIDYGLTYDRSGYGR